VVLNLSEGLAAQIAAITMLAKDCPADDEALKIVVVERAGRSSKASLQGRLGRFHFQAATCRCQ
jgi:hypothetical protein